MNKFMQFVVGVLIGMSNNRSGGVRFGTSGGYRLRPRYRSRHTIDTSTPGGKMAMVAFLVVFLGIWGVVIGSMIFG